MPGRRLEGGEGGGYPAAEAASASTTIINRFFLFSVFSFFILIPGQNQYLPMAFAY